MKTAMLIMATIAGAIGGGLLLLAWHRYAQLRWIQGNRNVVSALVTRLVGGGNHIGCRWSARQWEVEVLLRGLEVPGAPAGQSLSIWSSRRPNVGGRFLCYYDVKGARAVPLSEFRRPMDAVMLEVCFGAFGIALSITLATASLLLRQ